MNECIKCKSKRLISISGKTSDCFCLQYQDKDYDGYVPDSLGIDDGGDYISFTYCADCGQIQGKFPVEEENLSRLFEEEEE